MSPICLFSSSPHRSLSNPQAFRPYPSTLRLLLIIIKSCEKKPIYNISEKKITLKSWRIFFAQTQIVMIEGASGRSGFFRFRSSRCDGTLRATVIFVVAFEIFRRQKVEFLERLQVLELSLGFLQHHKISIGHNLHAPDFSTNLFI